MYYSLDDDPEGVKEKAAREIERRRVLEAVGLVVSPLADGVDKAPRLRPCVPSGKHGRHVPSLSGVIRSSSGSIGPLSESPGRKRRLAPATPRRGLAHVSTRPIPTLDFPDTDPSPDVVFGALDTPHTHCLGRAIVSINRTLEMSSIKGE